jgi:hypothetical protein
MLGRWTMNVVAGFTSRAAPCRIVATRAKARDYISLRRDGPEYAVMLVGVPCRKEQCVGGASSGVIAKSKAPQSVNPHWSAGALFQKDTNEPPTASKAVIKPLPKFPINSRLLSSPKLAGASATPQGASNQEPVSNLRRRTPFGVNTSTKPSPFPATSSCASLSCFANVTTTAHCQQPER